MKRWVGWAGWSMWLGLSGCAFTPGGKMEEALRSNQAVIISPVFVEGGALWVRQGNPDQRFMLLDLAQTKNRIGEIYQMAVVEPGIYHLVAASSYAGPGRADPKGLSPQPLAGSAGQLKMFNRTYSEPYTERVWKERMVQRVVIPGSGFCASMGPYGDCRQWIQNPSTFYDQVAQEAGWYEEKRFRPPANVVDFLMEFGGREPLATLEVRAGETLLISSLRVPARDVGYDDARCTPLDGKKSYTCPLNSVRAELGQINLAFFREQATAGRLALDPALVARVQPYALKPRGQRVGQSNDGLAQYEFRGAAAVGSAGPAAPRAPAVR